MPAIRPDTRQATASMTEAPSKAAAKSRLSLIKDRNAVHPDPISAPC
jgi:hypothetical protein